MEFPVSLDTLIEKLYTYNPVKEIFNVISFSVDPMWKENIEVYACPDPHQTIKRIRATRGAIPLLGLPTSHNIGERSVGDIVNWSPEFISM